MGEAIAGRAWWEDDGGAGGEVPKAHQESDPRNWRLYAVHFPPKQGPTPSSSREFPLLLERANGGS